MLPWRVCMTKSGPPEAPRADGRDTAGSQVTVATKQSEAYLGVFLVFAGTYFLSALLRAVTATLAPAFSAEFGLGAADLGLLAGVYFLGFSLLQLPLGAALDRFGPRCTEVTLLLLAVLGCALFAAASTYMQLVGARALIGMGVAACLMAPLTYFRRHFSQALQLRLNSWMLMTGSVGMLASTVPVQWVLPMSGWRGLFTLLAALLAVGALALFRGLEADGPSADGLARQAPPVCYAEIVRHPVFVRLAPLGFVLYGGLIAVQALWAGPWLTQVCGWTAQEAGQGLLLVNAGMLVAFFSWGMALPALHRAGVDAWRLLSWGTPVGLVILAAIAWAGSSAAALSWVAWCVSTSVLAVSQPAVGQAFPVRAAGRALSAFNLVIFSGVFALQWGIGVVIDALQRVGLAEVDAYRSAMAGLLVLGVLSYLWFLAAPRADDHNAATEVPT